MRGAYFAGAATETPRAPVFSMARDASRRLGVLDGGLEVLGAPRKHYLRIDVPWLSVEELAAQIANGTGVQIVDARAREHMSLNVDLMAGATWHDPDRVEEWIAELTPGKPVAVYCSYGFDVGCNVAKTLIERGFDARFVRGGASAWYASGGARALRPGAGSHMAER